LQLQLPNADARNFAYMLSHRLGLLVKAKGLTQKSVADSMGVTEQALSRYLQGKTAIGSDSLELLLSALGMNLEKVVDAEIVKVMKTREKKPAKGRNLLSELQEEQVAKIVAWYSKTAKKPVA
jgi:transcriptional regulator with XRE-family HTH domain